MIYTRFGEPVTVIGGDAPNGKARIRYTNGAEMEVLFYDLKADGGIQEIWDAVKKAKGGEGAT